jgi:hypothetical protein
VNPVHSVQAEENQQRAQEAAVHAAAGLGDFTADRRTVFVAAIAVVIGAIATVVASRMLDDEARRERALPLRYLFAFGKSGASAPGQTP